MTIQLLTGDCRDVLPTLASNSVHCVVTSPPYYALRSYLDASHPDKHRELGSEPTPDAYIATMVAVFREVKRILRNDGVMFLNIGDSYASSTKGSGGHNPKQDSNRGSWMEDRRSQIPPGLKPKDLLMMPARLALALQADGWWVRSDIIWAKPNPMPESCTDRPTSAHEHVFLLAKKPRYYFDAAAIAEPALQPVGEERRTGQGKRDELRATGIRNGNGTSTSILGSNQGAPTRACRNVWTIATHAFPQAHFATYPPALVERCIRAGTSERGCCAACGAPWQRITDKTFVPQPDVSLQRGIKGAFDQKPMDASSGWDGFPRGTTQAVTTGWRASCQCQAETQPCTVLDCFSGAGTTALVADRLQRHCVGIDLSTTYADLARTRIEADAPLFTSWAPAEDPEEARMRDLFAEAAE